MPSLAPHIWSSAVRMQATLFPGCELHKSGLVSIFSGSEEERILALSPRYKSRRKALGWTSYGPWAARCTPPPQRNWET